MGIIRGGMLVFVSVILFFSFIIASSFIIVSDSLSYDKVHDELAPVVSDVLSSQMNLEDVSSEKLILMQAYCVNHTEFVFSEGDETFEIPCSVVSENSSLLIENMVSNKIDEVYYADYDCGFLDCLEKQRGMPFFLISEHTRNYFENKFYLLATFCLILSGGVFLLVNNKSNAPIVVGGLLLASSLIFIKLDNFLGLFADKTILNFFGFLFTSSYALSIKGIIIAVILIIIGLIFKFFKIGFWISNFTNKFRKEGIDKSKTKFVVKKGKNSKK